MLRMKAGRQAKVGELDMPAAVEEYVIGFDVTGLRKLAVDSLARDSHPLSGRWFMVARSDA